MSDHQGSEQLGGESEETTKEKTSAKALLKGGHTRGTETSRKKISINEHTAIT